MPHNLKEFNAQSQLHPRVLGELNRQYLLHFCLNVGFISAQMANTILDTKRNKALAGMVKRKLLNKTDTGLRSPSVIYYLTKRGAAASLWAQNDPLVPQPITNASKFNLTLLLHDSVVAEQAAEWYQVRREELIIDLETKSLEFEAQQDEVDRLLNEQFIEEESLPKTARQIALFGRKGKIPDLIITTYESCVILYEYERAEKTRDQLDRFWVGLLAYYTQHETSITIMCARPQIANNYLARLAEYQGLIPIPNTNSRSPKPWQERIITSDFLYHLFVTDMKSQKALDGEQQFGYHITALSYEDWLEQNPGRWQERILYYQGKKLTYYINPGNQLFSHPDGYGSNKRGNTIFHFQQRIGAKVTHSSWQLNPPVMDDDY